ncbi:MAG: putative DNA repair protein YkoV [Candidatus Dependentiae bacterium ADurb.Bin331]|nr:MAG: putative DNA repair protein YkoV [Candidatus Dependentiae bacterium ADurb.Bin331]
MKTIWKGAISFGLVNIPIKLYTATESHALGFTLLHSVCHTPLKYHRWCTKCNKEVIWADTVKGIKTEKGYMVLTKEMIAKLRPEKSEAIQIIEFIDQDAVEPIYFNHQYFVIPEKEKDSAYALFTQALINLNKVAIGKFVMRDKEYVCALKPYQDYLLLITLHYAYEVKNVANLQTKTKIKLEPKEIRLAEELIKKLSVNKFDITDFKDTFAQEIKALLQEFSKKKTRKIKPKELAQKLKVKKPTSLMESLRASLELNRSRPAIRAKGKK